MPRSISEFFAVQLNETRATRRSLPGLMRGSPVGQDFPTVWWPG
jgi:hypothetical protein